MSAGRHHSHYSFNLARFHAYNFACWIHPSIWIPSGASMHQMQNHVSRHIQMSTQPSLCSPHVLFKPQVLSQQRMDHGSETMSGTPTSSVGPSGGDRLNTTVWPAVEATPLSGTDSAPPSGPAASTRKARHAQTKAADDRAGAGSPGEEQGGRSSRRQQRRRRREQHEQQRGCCENGSELRRRD